MLSFDQCGRSIAPIILRCDGPTERIPAFVDRLIQPTAQKQDSYLKDTTNFLNFSTKLPKNTVLVSMDVTSLHTNISHEEGVTTVSQDTKISSALSYINRKHVPILR